MRCSKCNSKIRKKTKFCPECGIEIVCEEKDTSRTYLNHIRVLIVIGVLLLIAIITVGILLVLGNMSKVTVTNVSEPTSLAFSENPEAITLASQSVVKINCYDSNDTLCSTGSGFAAFEKGVIVTNYHVIEEVPKRIEIVTEAGKTCEIKYGIAASKERDLAILFYPPDLVDFDLPLLPIRSSTLLQKGEKVVAIGSPLGLTNVVSTGVFSGYNNDGETTDLQFTASISSGSSGGALFNNNGEVIGITYASYEAGQNLNLAVPIEFVETLYKNNSIYKVSLNTFYDSLVPCYTVAYVLANYADLKDEEFYLTGWVSSWGKTKEGYVAYLATSKNDVYDISENDMKVRFKNDSKRYPQSSLIKVVEKTALSEISMEIRYKRGKEIKIKFRGVEWSKADQKPYLIDR